MAKGSPSGRTILRLDLLDPVLYRELSAAPERLKERIDGLSEPGDIVIAAPRR